MLQRNRPKGFAALGALMAVSLLAVAACGNSDTEKKASDDNPVVEGSFDYTDVRGEKIALENVPRTVVAQSSVAAALWDAGYKVSGVYGELGEVDGELTYQAGAIDLDQVEVLGKTYGEFDTTKFALLEPDLLIDFAMDGSSLWYVPAEQVKQVKEIATTIGLQGQGLTGTDEAIQMFVDLAGKLGADVESAELAEDKAAYDAALERVRTAAKGKKEVKVLLMSLTQDGAYAAAPTNFPEVQTLKDAGVSFVEVDADQATGGFFEQLSWEQVGKYDADVILYDARTAAGDSDEIMAVPTWSRLPAVKAGQVYAWRTAAPYSWKQYAGIYDEIATWLEKVETVS